MVEKKSFPANIKHQYRVSQREEHDFSTDNKKNRGYGEHQILSLFTDEL